MGHPKLIIGCVNHYDPQSRCIKKVLGEVLAKISMTTVVSALKIPHKEPYEPWNFEEEERLYRKKKKDYKFLVAQSWLLKQT